MTTISREFNADVFEHAGICYCHKDKHSVGDQANATG
jgi:hypothetical protein